MGCLISMLWSMDMNEMVTMVSVVKGFHLILIKAVGWFICF